MGLGPCGELRYPAYRGDRWSYPGVGAFQCYDVGMLNLAGAADLNVPDPSVFNTSNLRGPYSATPEEVPFFK